MAAFTHKLINYNPTHDYNGIKYGRGRVLPFGATMVPEGVNFSVFSSDSTSCTLVLFDKNEEKPFAEIKFPDEFRIGNVYSMVVFHLDYETLEYGYRMDGPFDERAGLRFDNTKVLSDPYAKVIGGREIWMGDPKWDSEYRFRSRLVFEDFDWEGDVPIALPIEDMVVYEAHVRSFTMHPSSGLKYKGTFASIREKIPYLKDLGINCVELMPIYEFDEWEHNKKNPDTGENLINYWGYSTVNFFSPKAGYAALGKLGMQVDELKTMVKELHAQGIEVLLDVVFNHTAEGDERGPTISFRGLDNKTYYMLTDGYYLNYSGTGNTLNCNNPIVRNMVLDCLRYWAAEYHVDGFRFDLAAILGRGLDGKPLSNPPLLESLAYDPVLAKCKLIAEAWDAGGLYQVGVFPAYGRWAEWNGKYRDTLRKFIKGDAAMIARVIEAVQGSPLLYPTRGTTAGVNFVTCHDGFTLFDLFSYNEKHNEANGEDNKDGNDDNDSWNCGHEGETEDAGINRLRYKLIKNAISILFVSQGVPMLLMGDEMGRTQKGNNNSYCHDNEISWLDWGLREKNESLYYFTKHMIAFRKAHPALRNRNHFANKDYKGTGYPDISFHGKKAWTCNLDDENRAVAFMLDGNYAKDGAGGDDYLYVGMNMHWESAIFELPGLPAGMQWHVSVNTDMPTPDDFKPLGREEVAGNQQQFTIGPRAVIILVGKHPAEPNNLL